MSRLGTQSIFRKESLVSAGGFEGGLAESKECKFGINEKKGD
jgi:hypothetical protein